MMVVAIVCLGNFDNLQLFPVCYFIINLIITECNSVRAVTNSYMVSHIVTFVPAKVNVAIDGTYLDEDMYC